MNGRLQKFLEAENITQSQMADRLGVAKASISHILAGRNKPGFEFIQNMARCFPDLNLEWLITGKGKMYKSAGERLVQPEIPRQEPPVEQDLGLFGDNQSEPDLFPNDNAGEAAKVEEKVERDSPSESSASHPKIVKIMVFYDNGTFKELE